jgi:hypothetical protein
VKKSEKGDRRVALDKIEGPVKNKVSLSMPGAGGRASGDRRDVSRRRASPTAMPPSSSFTTTFLAMPAVIPAENAGTDGTFSDIFVSRVNMSAASAAATVFSLNYDFRAGNGDNGNV